MATQSKSRLDELRSLDPFEFEHFIANLWSDQGWQTQVLQASNDYGIDIVATKSDPAPQKVLIQAKRYAEGNRVGAPDVQQYRSLLEQEPDADSVIIVTTSGFTSQAQEIAERVNVKLVDGQALLDIIDGQGIAVSAPTTHETTAAAVSDGGSLLWGLLTAAVRDPEKVLELLVSGFVAILFLYIFGRVLWALLF